MGKVRIGSAHDGGYVLLDRLDGLAACLSFGVGDNWEFEADLGRRGLRVELFDHTVEGPEPDALPPRLRFHRQGISRRRGDAGWTETLTTQIRRHTAPGERLLLKIDVEGAEWDALAGTPRHDLARFEQIAIELHWLDRLVEGPLRRRVARVLRKINRDFVLFHVHGNNNSAVADVAGLAVVQVIECSYVRSDLVRASPSKTAFPTACDAPNYTLRPDIELSFFPFLPT